MSPETLFQVANPLALAGWLMLAAYPLAPRFLMISAGYVLPLILSASYAALIALHWGGAEGGYDSLANVMALFDAPGVALAGWTHYLAFDLFIGAWIVRQAGLTGVAHLALLPVLAATFLFGPVGLLLFFVLRAGRARLPLPAAKPQQEIL